MKASNITLGSDQMDNGIWPATVKAMAIQAVSGRWVQFSLSRSMPQCEMLHHNLLGGGRLHPKATATTLAAVNHTDPGTVMVL